MPRWNSRPTAGAAPAAPPPPAQPGWPPQPHHVHPPPLPPLPQSQPQQAPSPPSQPAPSPQDSPRSQQSAGQPRHVEQHTRFAPHAGGHFGGSDEFGGTGDFSRPLSQGSARSDFHRTATSASEQDRKPAAVTVHSVSAFYPADQPPEPDYPGAHRALRKLRRLRGWKDPKELRKAWGEELARLDADVAAKAWLRRQVWHPVGEDGKEAQDAPLHMRIGGRLAADPGSHLVCSYMENLSPGESDAVICIASLLEHPDSVIRRAGLIAQLGTASKGTVFYDARQQRWRYTTRYTPPTEKIKGSSLRKTRKDLPPGGILRVVGSVDFSAFTEPVDDSSAHLQSAQAQIFEHLKAAAKRDQADRRKQKRKQGKNRKQLGGGVYAAGFAGVSDSQPLLRRSVGQTFDGYDDMVESESDNNLTPHQELTRLAEAGDSEFLTKHEIGHHVRQYLTRGIPVCAEQERLVVFHTGTGDLAHQLAVGMRAHGPSSTVDWAEDDEETGAAGREPLSCIARGALVGVNAAGKWAALKREFTHHILVSEHPDRPLTPLQLSEFVDRLIESLADGHAPHQNEKQLAKAMKDGAPSSEGPAQRVPSRKSVSAVATMLFGGDPELAALELQQSVSRGYFILVVEGSGGYADELCKVLQELQQFNPLAQTEDLKARFLHGGPMDAFTERVLSFNKLVQVRKGMELEEFKRELVTCLKGDDTLQKAWIRYAQWLQAATGHQRWYRTYNSLQLALSILATFCAVMITFLRLIWGRYGCMCQSYSSVPEWAGIQGATTTTTPKLPEDWWGRQEYTGGDLGEGLPPDQMAQLVAYIILQWCIIIIPIAMSLSQALCNQLEPGESWVQFRLAHEEALRNIYMYRTRTQLYSDKECRRHSPKTTLGAEMPSDGLVYSTREELLSLVLCNRQNELSQIIPANRVAPWEGSVPPPNIRTKNKDEGFNDLTPDKYLEVRLQKKREHYHDLSAEYEGKIRLINLSVIFFSALGSLLAAIAAPGVGVLQAWIAFTTCVIAQLQRFLEFSKLEQLHAEFNKADNRLSNVELWFAQLGQKKDQADNIDRLVGDAEQVIGDEVAMWANRMTSKSSRKADLDEAEQDKQMVKKAEDDELEAEAQRRMRHLGIDALSKDTVAKAMENRQGPEAQKVKQALIRLNEEVPARPAVARAVRHDVWVTSPEWPAIAGHYRPSEAEIHNGYAVWVCGGRRVYTTDAGKWAICDTPEMMLEDASLAETHNPHGPDELPFDCKWKVVVDRTLATRHFTTVSKTTSLRQDYWVCSPARPDATGVYRLDPKLPDVNGWPVYARQDMRLFSNKAGNWMLSLTFGGMSDDRGWAQTAAAHGGSSPSAADLAWELYLSRVWTETRTGFVFDTEPPAAADGRVPTPAPASEQAEQGDAGARKRQCTALKDVTSFLLSISNIPRNFAVRCSRQNTRKLFAHILKPEGIAQEGLSPHGARVASHQRLVDLVRSAPIGEVGEQLADMAIESFLESVKSMALFEIATAVFSGVETSDAQSHQLWSKKRTWSDPKQSPPTLCEVLTSSEAVEDFVAELQTILQKVLSQQLSDRRGAQSPTAASSVRGGASSAPSTARVWRDREGPHTVVIPGADVLMTQVRDETLRTALQRVYKSSRESLFQRGLALLWLVEASRLGALDASRELPRTLNRLRVPSTGEAEGAVVERPGGGTGRPEEDLADIAAVAEFCMLCELWLNVSQQLADLDIDQAMQDDSERALMVHRLRELRKTAGDSLETMERAELLERLPPKFRKLMRKRSVAQICASIQRMLSGTPASRVVDALLARLDAPGVMPGLRKSTLFQDPTLSERFVIAAEALNQKEVNVCDRGVLVRRLRVHPAYTKEIDTHLATLEDDALRVILSVVQATFANGYAGRLIDRLTDELVSLDLKALLPIEDREKFAVRAREFQDMPMVSIRDVVVSKGTGGHIPFTVTGATQCVVDKVEFPAHCAGLRKGMVIVSIGRDREAIPVTNASRALDLLNRPGSEEVVLQIDQMQGIAGKRMMLDVLCFSSLRNRLGHLSVQQLDEIISTTVWLMNAQLQRRVWERIRDLPHMRQSTAAAPASAGQAAPRFDPYRLSDEAIDRLFRYAENCRESPGGAGAGSVVLRDLECPNTDSIYIKERTIGSQSARSGHDAAPRQKAWTTMELLERIGDSVLSSELMHCPPEVILTLLRTIKGTQGDQTVMNMFETVLSGLLASGHELLSVKFQAMFLVCHDRAGAGVTASPLPSPVRSPAKAGLQAQIRFQEWVMKNRERRDALMRALGAICTEEEGTIESWDQSELIKHLESYVEMSPDPLGSEAAPARNGAAAFLAELRNGLPSECIPGFEPQDIKELLKRLVSEVSSTVPYRLFQRVASVTSLYDLREVFAQVDLRYRLLHLIDDMLEARVIDIWKCRIADVSTEYDDNAQVAGLREQLLRAADGIAKQKGLEKAENWPHGSDGTPNHVWVKVRTVGEVGEIVSIVENEQGLHYAVRPGRRIVHKEQRGGKEVVWMEWQQPDDRGKYDLILTSPDSTEILVPPKRYVISKATKLFSELAVEGVITALRTLTQRQLEDLIRTTAGVLCREWGGAPAGMFYRENQRKLRQDAAPDRRRASQAPGSPRRASRASSLGTSPVAERETFAAEGPRRSSPPPSTLSPAATPKASPVSSPRRRLPSVVRARALGPLTDPPAWAAGDGGKALLKRRITLQAIGVLKSKMRNPVGRRCVLQAFFDFDAERCAAEDRTDRAKRVQLLIEDEEVVDVVTHMRADELEKLFSHLRYLDAVEDRQPGLKQRCARQRDEDMFFDELKFDAEFSDDGGHYSPQVSPPPEEGHPDGGGGGDDHEGGGDFPQTQTHDDFAATQPAQPSP
eukprot:TRINITY_DN5472_c0_g1_i4.p1 TRINITY_DN5472_c0_g1~~TRINITY_DN5472_c0_g1_i4.p1  ORF type:complete len:2861 (+),score=930.10 TRINITY_DN5472_c0_g1_i4:173-8755(+)